ncbi:MULTISPECIES: hypothetical protein [unclassified Bradyrhizobium]|uniref:hypothetical protein n=1 Tax=unclassified Bradyrhizobium TaxID=2631580 RepID=UPI00247A3D57|nr:MULTISPECIES: hypothetical protein [unclassified Bradyrhizobium]WGS17778.1 hypothetical protein MTX22_24490 [Bradyrhizobium sp. ISRA463]WGS24573.1 hypothetical protein MTX19_22155 [Bradyrhizobium sp. ISRA464]
MSAVGRHFLSFIEAHRGLYPATYLDELLIENVDQIMIRFLTMINEDDRVKAAGDDPTAIIEAKRTTLDDFLSITRTYPLTPPLTDENVAAIRAKHLAKLEQEAEADLNLFSEGAPLDKTALVDLGLNALFRRPEVFLSQTGIVIAGLRRSVTMGSLTSNGFSTRRSELATT